MEKEVFIEKAKAIHGNKYDYSKVDYKSNHEKILIICPIHGEFWQTPKNHLKGCGCPKCSGVYKMSTKEWVEVAKRIHGDKYDYSNVEYKNNKEKVCIICPRHGEFWQIAGNHLKGEGCIQCRNEQLSINRRDSKEDFILKAKKLYGDKYGYSKVDYVNSSTKVCIICPKHGEFWKTPSNFLNGQGCPKCNIKEKPVKEKVNPTEKFIAKAKEKFGDKYDYSKVEYINSKTKVCFICPKHGEFWGTPNKFLGGKCNCPQCKKDERENLKINRKDIFIKRARERHGEKYDYNEIDYKGTQERVKIICHKKDKNGDEHGVFYQTAGSHLSGCGCPKCAEEVRAKKRAKTTEQFIKEAKEKFPDFDYSNVEYVNQYTPVSIICHKKKKDGTEHGEFKVLPNKFLSRGDACPSCSHSTSYPEKEIYEFIKDIVGTNNVRFHDRTILNGDEIDIYLPEHKLGIEFNGLYWHSEALPRITQNFHVNKTKKCEDIGIHLVQIFSDEYFSNKELVKEKIRHLINSNGAKEKIMARKCTIREIDWNTSKIFLEKYHIQGVAVSTVYLGAYYNEKLIGVMTFLKEKEGVYCLNRFATDYNVICSGIGGKLFSYFIKNYTPDKIKSFADRRWSYIKNNLYLKLGFKEDKILYPDYKYIYKNKPSLGRIHKFNFRKQVIAKKYGLSMEMSEREMAEKIGVVRIYDCGLIRYIWESKK